MINPVSLNRDGSRNNMSYETAAMRALANLDDDTIKQLAYGKASVDVKDKRHRRLTNAIFYTIPFAAGLASAVRAPEYVLKSKKGNVNLSRISKLGSFASTSIGLLAALGAIDAVFGVKRAMDNKSASVNKFSENNPVISTLATAFAAFAAIFAINKGGAAILNKVSQKGISLSAMKKGLSFNNKLNNSKFLNKVSEKMAKVPSALKEFGKGVLDWSPAILILTSFAHSIGHEKAKYNRYENNYKDIKTAQSIAQEELEIMNENHRYPDTVV